MILAICDDDAASLARISQQTTAYGASHDTEVRCCYYATGQALMNALLAGMQFDGFLLDILMPGTDGIALGQAIRTLHEDAPLAYVTSSPEFALSAYQVKAVRYLTKPVQAEELWETIRLFQRLSATREPARFALRTPTGVVQLDPADILYVENILHTIAVSLRKEDAPLSSVNYRCSFPEIVAPLLARPSFLQTHKSFIVNLNRVKWYAPDSFTMENGMVIPISQKFKKDVHQTYLSYFETGGGV